MFGRSTAAGSDNGPTRARRPSAGRVCRHEHRHAADGGAQPFEIGVRAAPGTMTKTSAVATATTRARASQGGAGGAGRRVASLTRSSTTSGAATTRPRSSGVVASTANTYA